MYVDVQKMYRRQSSASWRVRPLENPTLQHPHLGLSASRIVME